MNKVISSLLLSGIALFFCLFPTWIWLTAWYFSAPDGFWQKMLLVGIGLWFFGGLQFILAIVLAAALLLIWSS